MVPCLLPIFLHSCEIKSGSGLGTKLDEMCLVSLQNLSTVHSTEWQLETRLHWVRLNIILDGELFAYPTYFTQHIHLIAILIPSTTSDTIYLVSAAVYSRIWRKHIIILLTNLQKLPCWVPVATCATTSGIEWSHIPAIHPALHGAYNKQMISVPAAGRDLAVRMRAIVPAPIFPACGGAPTYCYAEQWSYLMTVRL